MKLEDWIKQSGMSKYEFARRVGIRWQTLWNYLKGRQTPRLEIAVKIEEVTGGQVKPRDLVK